MLTHLWPTIDPVASVEEGSEAFGAPVTLAAPAVTGLLAAFNFLGGRWALHLRRAQSKRQT